MERERERYRRLARRAGETKREVIVGWGERGTREREVKVRNGKTRMVAKVQISARIHRKVFFDVVFRLSSRSWVVKISFRAFDRRPSRGAAKELGS